MFLGYFCSSGHDRTRVIFHVHIQDCSNFYLQNGGGMDNDFIVTLSIGGKRSMQASNSTGVVKQDSSVL